MTNKLDQDSFDRRAAKYTPQRVDLFNEATRTCPNARSIERQLILDRLALVPGLHIADVGAGGGYLAEGISAAVDGDVHITCIENSESFAETIDPTYSIVISSLGDIGLPDASVDRVACLAGLHHQEDKLAFVREAFRILKPNGIIVVADGLQDSPTARFLNGPVDRFTDLGHDGMFLRHKEFTDLMQQAGFTAIREQYETYHWPFPDRRTMIAFSKSLFRMGGATLDQVEEAIDEYLGSDPLPEGIGMRWGLIYCSASKPAPG